MIALNGCQWNRTIYDIDPRLPWLVVGVSIMEKRLWTQRTSEPAKSDLRPHPQQKRSGVSPPGWFSFSRHNIKKVASGWNRRRGPLKMDQDNLRKSCNGKLWQILKQDEKQNYQKAAEWDEWPRWDILNHWKASPMMKNQQQRLKGKILIK